MKNQGDGQTQQAWYDGLYLSIDDKLDDSDIDLIGGYGYLHSAPLSADESYTGTVTIRIPGVAVGNYYLLGVTDRKAPYFSSIYESREGNNVLPKLITIVKEGEETDLSEKFSSESTLVEELFSQKATLSNVIVTGDLTGTLNFTHFEIVSINSGSFAGKGFSKGEWITTLEGITYQGDWQGVSFLVEAERKIYLKGTISGSEASGIVEGYLTESSPGSGIYDKYFATWKLGRLGGETVSATINLEGTLNYTQSTEYPVTDIHVLQSAVEATVLGHYHELVNVVLTHLRIASQENPYFGEGFSIISYVSQTGSGEGWTYDKAGASGKIELMGMFTSPLLGIVSGLLDESVSPKTLSLGIERIDLGLPPAPDLKVKVWGPQRVSPGQTINYIIEHRNDGVKAAEKAIVTVELPTFSEYKLASQGAFYNDLADTVSWDLGVLPPKKAGYLSLQVSFPWGLPDGLEFDIPAYITLIEHHSTEENLLMNGFQLETEKIPDLGVDNPDVEKFKSLASLFNAKWEPVYNDVDFFEATPHAFAAMLGIPTDKNGLSKNQGNRPKVLTYSGSTISGVSMIEKDLVTTDELHVASLVLTSQDRLQKLSEKGVEKVVVYYSQKDDLIPQPIILKYSSVNQEPEFNIVVLGIKFPYQSQELSLKVRRMIAVGEEIFSKNFNKPLKVKTLNIFSDKRGNQVELEMIDEQDNIFPLMLPDGNELPKSFYIQNDMKTGQPIKSEGIIQVEEVENVSHAGWPGYLILKFRLLKIGQKISETWKNVVSFFKILITTARDPNQKLVSPEGNVVPGQRLTYTVEYENEGEGIAFGVYFTDTLDEDLDDTTLEIGSVIDVKTGSQIAPAGTYNPQTRTITWFVGEVGPGQGGYTEFSVNIRQDALDGTEVINYATVYFPSVPEATRTNGTVNKVTTFVDNVPPTTTATVSSSPNQSGWNNTDVTITLTATDTEEGSGVKEIHYRLNGAVFDEKVISGNSASISISSEGTTTITYWSVDNLDNVEPPKSLEIKLDKTLPTITAQTSPPPNSYGWNNTDVTVSFTATDNLSGIATVTEPSTLTTEGKDQYIGGEAIDFADNRNSTSATVNLDKTPPEVSLQLQPLNISPPYRRGFLLPNFYKLIYSANDNLSGLKSLQAGLVIPNISDFKAELKTYKTLEIRIDEKKKELKIKAPDPEKVLKDLKDGLFNLNPAQTLQLKLKQGEPKWKIKEKEKGLEIQAPSIIFKAIAVDVADNIATKELGFKGGEGED